jgi:hypothetical protein
MFASTHVANDSWIILRGTTMQAPPNNRRRAPQTTTPEHARLNRAYKWQRGPQWLATERGAATGTKRPVTQTTNHGHPCGAPPPHLPQPPRGLFPIETVAPLPAPNRYATSRAPLCNRQAQSIGQTKTCQWLPSPCRETSSNEQEAARCRNTYPKGTQERKGSKTQPPTGNHCIGAEGTRCLA